MSLHCNLRRSLHLQRSTYFYGIAPLISEVKRGLCPRHILINRGVNERLNFCNSLGIAELNFEYQYTKVKERGKIKIRKLQDWEFKRLRGQQRVRSVLHTFRITVKSSHRALDRLSYTGPMELRLCFKLIILFIDCSECFREGFVMTVMSYKENGY